MIDRALETAREQIEDLDLYVLQHKVFGKGDMKKCKLSPDAFVQMALQLAYFKVSTVTVLMCSLCICILCLSTNLPCAKFSCRNPRKAIDLFDMCVHPVP